MYFILSLERSEPLVVTFVWVCAPQPYRGQQTTSVHIPGVGLLCLTVSP